MFFVKLKPAETYTHTHTHTCNLLLSPKQIGTICFAIFSILISAPTFATGVSSTATSADCDNATLDTYSGTSNLQAGWQPNTIDLHWYNGDDELTVPSASQSCVYDGTLTLPTTIPTKTGYTFKGWTVRGLPAGYTRLQYIESTGTQWIDTGIKLASTDVIFTEFKNTTSSSYGGLYGVYKSGQSSAFYANQTYYAYDGNNTKIDTTISVDANWHKLTHDFVQGIFQLDNTIKNFTPFTFTNTVNNHLFERYSSSYGYNFTGAVKIYRISRNGNLVRDLIPAKRNSDNVVGMYDTVSKTFFTNAGTGTFTGPVEQ